MPLSEDTDGTLSAFRNLPYLQRKIKIRQTKGVPMKVGLIGKFALKELHLDIDGPRDVLHTNWVNIVPHAYVQKSTPTTIIAGVLTIRAENSVVKQQLLFEKQGILQKIRSYPACSEITKIRII